MATPEPLDRFVLKATSRADDLGFVAMADLSAAISEGAPVDWRLIGGHMVQLHVYRWGLGADLYRETQDADLGVHPIAVAEAHLIDRLQRRGYVKVAGNRFARSLDDLQTGIPRSTPPQAVIDILIPSYTSRPRSNHPVGVDLVTTEVAGLATALQRGGISTEIEAIRLNGDHLAFTVILPDEAGALVLKAFAWRSRRAGRDAIDVWRCLEVAAISGLTPGDFRTHDENNALMTLREDFGGRDSNGIRAIAGARRLAAEATDVLSTRVQALLMRVIG